MASRENPDEQQIRIIFQRRKRTSMTAFCVKCDKRGYLILPEEIRELFPDNWERLLPLVEGGQIHRIHNSHALIRLCFSSAKRAAVNNEEPHMVMLRPLL
jgi:hypothetical protein